MSTTINSGLVNAEEAQVNTIKPNSGTSVTIQDADGNDRLTVDGDGVTIAGTTTTVDIATVTVDDKNVEINAVASPTDANADGGGLTLKGDTDKTIAWTNSTDAWHFNQGINVTSGEVGIGTDSPSGKLEVVSGNDGDGTIAVRSGDASQYSKISVGTDANKATIGVPGAADTFFTDTAAGDMVIRADDNNSKVHIGAGSSGPAGLVVSEVAGSGRVGVGVSSPKTKLTVEGSITLKEQAAADSDTAAYGQLWTKTATPNELYYTTDAGHDIQITDGTSLAGGGGGASALDDLSDVDYSGGDLEIASLDKIISGSLLFDSSGDITLDVDGDDVVFKAGSDDTTGLKFTQSGSGDWTILAGTSDKDIVFQGNDGGVATEILRIDASEPAVLIKGGAASSGKIRIYEDSDAGAHYAEINVPSLTASYSLSLPDGDGDANQILTTNGSGVLSWGPPAIYNYEAVTSTPGSALTTQQIVSCNPTSGAIVLTLPAASTAGKTMTIKNASAVTANTITINRAGSDTIDGETSIVMSTAYSAITIYSDGGTGWWVI